MSELRNQQCFEGDFELLEGVEFYPLDELCSFRDNPADHPSRECSDLDCTLSESALALVERLYGPHTFDLMALDSNCRRDSNGVLLPHFSPWPTPLSNGINVFAQPVPTEYNIYVFPPFLLMGPLLRFLIDQLRHIAFTVIVPDLRPRRYWWAILQSISVDRHRLGLRGSVRTLLFPSRRSPGFYPKPLQWDLWAFRCLCH
jgi:hypothetical protein